MNYKEILNLMKEMNKTALTRLEIEEEGFRICIEKAAAGNAGQQASPAPAFIPAITQEIIAQPQASLVQAPDKADGSGNEANTEDESNYKKIVSPMVGTFYAAPAPDKPPYVKVGDKVKKGQIVCIIEAMKLMNEIESDFDGEIVKVLVNNEEMVEYGQPLFLVK